MFLIGMSGGGNKIVCIVSIVGRSAFNTKES